MMIPDGLGVDLTAAKELAPQLPKLKESSEQLEAHFIKEMLQAMKKAMPDTTEGEGFGNDQYQDMFDDAVSNALSKNSGLGIAQTVYKSLEPKAFAMQRTKVLREAQAAKANGTNRQ
jgi:Rod binding domain-containing protein